MCIHTHTHTYLYIDPYINRHTKNCLCKKIKIKFKTFIFIIQREIDIYFSNKLESVKYIKRDNYIAR